MRKKHFLSPWSVWDVYESDEDDTALQNAISEHHNTLFFIEIITRETSPQSTFF